MVLLATEDTDASGKFVLRGDFDSTLDYMRDASGALSLMIVASSPGTFAISTDTVWWENGAWTSIDPAIGATTEKAMLAQASVSEDEGAVLPSSDLRPAVPHHGLDVLARACVFGADTQGSVEL